MNRRIESIDALRGITIFMMILCAAIGYDSGLPAWMFHCQVPPPDYVFKPEVRGITWVDLVFPIFIFAMGAAIPYWIGGKLRKGDGVLSICLQIVKRFVVLVAFSLAIGHASAIGGTSCPEILSGVVQSGIWLCMFAALWRTEHKWVNAAGWVAMAGLFLWMHFGYGLKFAYAQNDCIILLLAWVALFGGLVWLFTRERPVWRLVAFAAVIAAKLFGFDFTQYLVIAIPATMTGDLLRGYQSEGPKHFGACAWICLAAVLVQLWGLFTRNVFADLCISVALAAAFFFIAGKERSVPASIAKMGYLLLLTGILFDFIDGGIAKDYCNLSYLFTTCGQSMLLLFFLLWAESRHPLSRNLVYCGRNPMIAYTIAWSVICPLLSVVGILGLMDSLAVGSPVLGTLRGLVITLLTFAATCFFTHKKIFWKS